MKAAYSVLVLIGVLYLWLEVVLDPKDDQTYFRCCLHQ